MTTDTQEQRDDDWWRCPSEDCDGVTEIDDNTRYCTECDWSVTIPKQPEKTQDDRTHWYRAAQLALLLSPAAGYHYGGLGGMAAVGLGIAAAIRLQEAGMA